MIISEMTDSKIASDTMAFWQERVGQLLQANAKDLVSCWKFSALEYVLWGTQVLPKETMSSKPWVLKQCAGNRIGPGRSLMCQSSSRLRRGLQKRSQLLKPQKLKSPLQRRPANPEKRHLQCQRQEAGRPEQVVCHIDMELHKQIIAAKALIVCTWQYCEMAEESKKTQETQATTYPWPFTCMSSLHWRLDQFPWLWCRQEYSHCTFLLPAALSNLKPLFCNFSFESILWA